MRKKFALAGAMALAAAGVGVFGFAPTSSAQTIGACTNPRVCGFINASGFSILGFANGTYGFIGPTFTPLPTTFAAPTLGQWTLGSLPVAPRRAH